MRLAYFGGSFDPPHRAHLALARAAADAFALDRILFAPTGRQPLKPGGSHASFAHRLAMVEQLATLDPRLKASTLEAPRADSAPNYTVDTMRSLRATLTPADTLFGLIGIDSLASFPQWREPEALLELADWIVVTRPGLDADRVIADVVAPAQRSRIHLLDTVHDDISATALRARLQAGEDCTGLIPAPVLDYIRTHNLYR